MDYHVPRPATSTEFMIVVEMLQALTERLLCRENARRSLRTPAAEIVLSSARMLHRTQACRGCPGTVPRTTSMPWAYTPRWTALARSAMIRTSPLPP